jgi:hypothetical protein
MTARIKISQAGLSAGVAGRSRTDGLATGALVTVEDVSGTGTSTFHLLWGPIDDTTAEASLAATGDPDIWTFSPTAATYGSYLIELRVAGSPVERRVFGVRTPANHLLIPALNEHASRHANWTNEGADQIELSEQNANDFPLSALNSFRYAGWWRSLYELYQIVEFGTGSIADHALALIKLVTVPAKSFLVNAGNATGNVATLAGSAALQYPRVNAANNALEMATLSTHGSTSVAYDGASNTFQRAALTGAVTSSQNSNATALGAGVASTSVVNNGGSLERAALTGAVTSGQNSNATAFGTIAAKSILANSGNTTAAPAALSGAQARQYYRVTGANTGLEAAPLCDGTRVTATSVSAATTVLATSLNYSIPANTLQVGSRFQCEFTYQFIRGATATALNLGCFFDIGAQTMSVSPAAQTAAGTYQVRVVAEFTVTSTGAGGAAMATISVFGDGLAAASMQAHAANTGLAIDTTIANVIRGAAQMNTAVAATSITCTGGHTLQLN